MIYALAATLALFGAQPFIRRYVSHLYARHQVKDTLRNVNAWY